MAADWLTFGHDPQRTGWASEERSINPETAAKLTLLWKTKIDNTAQGLWSLTSPVVAENVSTRLGNKTVVYVAGISGTLFAIAADTGEDLWHYTVNNFVESRSHVYVYQGGFLSPTASPLRRGSIRTATRSISSGRMACCMDSIWAAAVFVTVRFSLLLHFPRTGA